MKKNKLIFFLLSLVLIFAVIGAAPFLSKLSKVYGANSNRIVYSVNYGSDSNPLENRTFERDGAIYINTSQADIEYTVTVDIDYLNSTGEDISDALFKTEYSFTSGCVSLADAKYAVDSSEITNDAVYNNFSYGDSGNNENGYINRWAESSDDSSTFFFGNHLRIVFTVKSVLYTEEIPNSYLYFYVKPKYEEELNFSIPFFAYQNADEITDPLLYQSSNAQVLTTENIENEYNFDQTKEKGFNYDLYDLEKTNLYLCKYSEQNLSANNTLFFGFSDADYHFTYSISSTDSTVVNVAAKNDYLFLLDLTSAGSCSIVVDRYYSDSGNKFLLRRFTLRVNVYLSQPSATLTLDNSGNINVGDELKATVGLNGKDNIEPIYEFYWQPDDVAVSENSKIFYATDGNNTINVSVMNKLIVKAYSLLSEVQKEDGDNYYSSNNPFAFQEPSFSLETSYFAAYFSYISSFAFDIDDDTVISMGDNETLTVNVIGDDVMGFDFMWNLKAVSGYLEAEIVPNKNSATVNFYMPGKYFVTAYLVLGETILSHTATVTVSASPSEFAVDKQSLTFYLDSPSAATVNAGTSVDGTFSPSINPDGYYSYMCNGDNVSVTENYDEESYNIKVTPLSAGSCIIIVYYKSQYDPQFAVINVVVKENSATTDRRLNFSVGNSISVFLDDKQNEISITNDLENNDIITWKALDTNIISVAASDSTANIIPLSIGETVLTASYTDIDGHVWSGYVIVEVLDETPTISISAEVTDGNGASSMTIYDLIKISVKTSYNFNFSKSQEVLWYLDGNLLQSALDEKGNTLSLDKTADEFYYKFTAGKHTLSVSIKDSEYGLNLSAERQINVNEIEGSTLSLGVDCDNSVLAILSGNAFSVTALLDGVVNDDYEYTWSIENKSVVSASVNIGTTSCVILKPIAEGKTEIYVLVTVDEYTNTTLNAKFTLTVQKLASISIESNENYYKPGESAEFTVLCNGQENVINFKPDFSVFLNDEEITDYTVSGNKLYFSALESGKLNVTASAESFKASSGYNVTNFNLEKLIRYLLPYLIILGALAILLAVVFRNRKTPIEYAQLQLNKLINETETVIGGFDYPTDKKAKSKITALAAKTKILISRCDLALDSGTEEIKPLCDGKIRPFMKVLIALMAIKNDDQSYMKKLISNSKRILLLPAKKELDQLTATYLLQYNDIKEAEKNDIKELMKKKEHTKHTVDKNYESFLKPYDEPETVTDAGDADDSDDAGDDGDDGTTGEN